MSYNPPYNAYNSGGQYGQSYSSQTYQPPYQASQSNNNNNMNSSSGAYSSSQQQPQYQPRNDQYDTEYDPYSGVARHPTYDQSGYRDNEYEDEAYPPRAGADARPGLGPGSGSASGLDSDNKGDKERDRSGDIFPPALRSPECVTISSPSSVNYL